MSFKLKQENKNLLSQEVSILKQDSQGTNAVAFLYPNTYKVGMSNLGYQIIYEQINLHENTYCERFFYQKDSQPISIERQRQMTDFSTLCVMLSFELDYFNFLEMLKNAGIPMLSNMRNEHHPIIIAGGACATFNPEPLAAFVDVFVIGEGERTIHSILNVLYSDETKHCSKEEKLQKLACIAGVYVPGITKQVKRQWLYDIDEFNFHYQIVTPSAEFSNMFAVEVSRGCTRHCRFCMAGYCFRNPREHSLDKIFMAIEKHPSSTEKIGLVGAGVCDYSQIDDLTKILTDRKMKFSFSSLRADMLTKEFLKVLWQNGQRTLTIAPEAGSVHMREIINKGIEEEDIINAVKMATEVGFSNIKLYFMVGLPFEQEADIAELIDLVRKLKEYLKHNSKLTLSINPFVPKPFTPFQWYDIIDKNTFKKRIDLIKDAFKKDRNINIKVESYKSSLAQAVLAKADNKISKYLLDSVQKNGLKDFLNNIKKYDLLSTTHYAECDCLPWDYIDMGFSKDYLIQENQKAKQQQRTIPCFDGCKRCGIC